MKAIAILLSTTLLAACGGVGAIEHLLTHTSGLATNALDPLGQVPRTLGDVALHPQRHLFG
jgi:hypothetical protein